MHPSNAVPLFWICVLIINVVLIACPLPNDGLAWTFGVVAGTSYMSWLRAAQSAHRKAPTQQQHSEDRG